MRVTVETCAQLGLRALTLYAFSVENWKRPRAEVETLWRLLRLYLRSELPVMLRHDIRFTAIGRLDALPGFVRDELEEVIGSTASNRRTAVESGDQLRRPCGTGGRGEVAGRGCARRVIDEAAISARLYTAGMPDPDLLIRTSGEMRVSNFLLWQIAYAELYVTETLWPDFTRAELLRAILDYQKRDRRFGGIVRTCPVHVGAIRFWSRSSSVANPSFAMKRLLTALVLIPLIVWLVLAAPDWAFRCGPGGHRADRVLRIRSDREANGSARAGIAGMIAGLALMFAPAPQVVVVIAALAGMMLAMRVADLGRAMVAARRSCWARSTFSDHGAARSSCATSIRHWLMFALLLSWAGDTAALYVGKTIGRHAAGAAGESREDLGGRDRIGGRRRSRGMGLRALSDRAAASWWMVLILAAPETSRVRSVICANRR